MATQLINFENIDASRIVFGKITTKEIKDPKTKKIKFRLTTCPVNYVNDDGDKIELIFSTPKFRTSGIMKQWPLELDEENCDDTNISGFQMCINITTNDTMDGPTDTEQLYMDKLDDVRKAAYEHIKKSENMAYLSNKCAGPASFLKAGIEGLKVAYSLPAEKERDGRTFTSPHQQYLKLLAYRRSKRKGEKITNPLELWDIKTRVKGPGNREVNPLKYVKVSGNCTLAIKLDRIYFGSHGDSAVGANLQFKVYECNFTPRSRENVQSLLPDNKDPEEMDIPDEGVTTDIDIKEEIEEEASDTFDPNENLDDLKISEDTPSPPDSPEKKPVRKAAGPRRRRIVKRAPANTD